MPEQSTFQDYLETLWLENNRDIVYGFTLLVVGLVLGFFIPSIGLWAGLAIGVYFLVSFFSTSSQGGGFHEADRSRVSASKPARIESTISAPVTNEATIADRIKAIHAVTGFKCPSCGAAVKPTSMICAHCGSILVASADLPIPVKWGEVEVGRNIRLAHPTDGELNLQVAYRIYYGELWQEKMRPNVPWTLTGSYFAGLGLDNGMYLLNWQSRYYLLNPGEPLTDNDINRKFAPAAREFAASNQTREVNLLYGKERWFITDIGRFRVEYVEGEERRDPQPGAVGRFIHAKNRNTDQVLILEDYQAGGGGLDNLRIGVQIFDKNIKL